MIIYCAKTRKFTRTVWGPTDGNDNNPIECDACEENLDDWDTTYGDETHVTGAGLNQMLEQAGLPRSENIETD